MGSCFNSQTAPHFLKNFEILESFKLRFEFCLFTTIMSYNLRSKPKMRENKSKRAREDSDDDFTDSPPRDKRSRVDKSFRKSNMNEGASQNSKSKKKESG